MLSGASTYAESVDTAMLVIVSISVVLLLGITAAMILFAIKYSRKRNPKAKQIKGNTLLEILWIGIPTILVLIMFWYGFSSFRELRETADAALVVNVTGKMWEWDFTYENGKKTDTLYVPLNQTTRLDMISVDVNHSFYIPAFRLKEDVIASRTNFMFITPEKTGEYDIACAEYCGVNHAFMYTKLIVMPENAFEAWYSAKESADTSAADTLLAEEQNMADAGQATDKSILRKKGCIACHSFDGSRMIGPSFAKLKEGKSTVLTGGEERIVKIDEEYIRKSIVEPNADVVKGYPKYSMPAIDNRSTPEEIDLLVETLKKIASEN